MAFFECLITLKFDFMQNLSGCKFEKCPYHAALTSYFESFWSIVCWHNSIPCSEECFEVFLVTNCLNSFSNLCLIFCLIRNVPNNHLFVRDLQIKISSRVFKVPLFYIWKKRISMPTIIE